MQTNIRPTEVGSATNDHPIAIQVVLAGDRGVQRTGAKETMEFMGWLVTEDGRHYYSAHKDWEIRQE
ncbi:hypothetical protein [Mycobacterium avium]|uniref:hypothetical protein n=1 Tax=Mycobacterium avium TaxID=1764 RepID=UPI0009FE1E39|nr:hypothetical protein [Mycobacterium avium]